MLYMPVMQHFLISHFSKKKKKLHSLSFLANSQGLTHQLFFVLIPFFFDPVQVFEVWTKDCRNASWEG
jgi:hypothetical protein